LNISSKEKIILDLQLYECLPIHSNISVICVYCNSIIIPGEINYYVEQPQARRRYTPICKLCYNKE
jgi:hypothetical protein